MAKLIRNQNDLNTENPELAKQWHPTKNGSLTPRDVTGGSGKEVWWFGKCGHEWKAKVFNRNRRNDGCPYCSNAKVLTGYNDLGTLYPNLVKEWDWDKNGSISPDNIMPGSHERIYWKCSQCGKEWVAEIRMRAQQGQGCPECAKTKMGVTFRKNLLAKGALSLEDEFPELAKEWHTIKNGELTPDIVTKGYSKHVWWICAECGYEWSASVKNRATNNSGCPACAGNKLVISVNDLQTKSPSLASEWNYEKNYPLKPSEVSEFSSRKVWWKCKYGHEYQCRVADRQKGVGCAKCSRRFMTSYPERVIEYYVKKYYPDEIANYRPAFLNNSEIDIYIPSLAVGIEYDGQRYHQVIERDKKKDELCKENGINLIRVREKRCPVYNRSDETFVIANQKDESFSQLINDILAVLGVDDKIDFKEDKQAIYEFFRDTAISGNIAEEYPEIAKQWHPSLNGSLKPENIPSTKSKDSFYWLCSKCGQTWKAPLAERINGTGCPVCAGKIIVPGINDLQTTHWELAKEWHPIKNGNLTPQMASKGQNKYVWWKCSKCGYEWRARINKRVSGSGCEQCANRKRGNNQYKKVYQFTEEGIFIHEYPSARVAAEELGISRSSIQHSCTGIGKKTVNGYVWSYNRNGEVYTRDDSIRVAKGVLQYDLDGLLLGEYKSAKEASEVVKISEGSIRQACNGTCGRKTAGGFIWKYKSYL